VAIGLYSVTTIASAHRRGYASLMPRALIDPDVAELLSPSPEAENLYRRLGLSL
jgi:hypothetical protein